MEGEEGEEEKNEGKEAEEQDDGGKHIDVNGATISVVTLQPG